MDTLQHKNLRIRKGKRKSCVENRKQKIGIVYFSLSQTTIQYLFISLTLSFSNNNAISLYFSLCLFLKLQIHSHKNVKSFYSTDLDSVRVIYCCILVKAIGLRCIYLTNKSMYGILYLLCVIYFQNVRDRSSSKFLSFISLSYVFPLLSRLIPAISCI